MQENKRTIPLLLALCMLLALLSACGEESASPASSAGEATSSGSLADEPQEDQVPAAPAVAESAAEPDSTLEGKELAGEEITGEINWDNYEYTAQLPLTEGITFDYWMSSQPFMMTYGGQIDYNTLPFYASMPNTQGGATMVFMSAEFR